MSDALQTLIEGYRQFHKEYLDKQYAAYRAWAAEAQAPRVMMIACSDSRVNPAILTHAGLGDVFTVNNVANLVPPYKEGHNTHHSTSSALEYAVKYLKVEHIIVLGHSQCGGIRALMQGVPASDGYSFIEPWVSIAETAKQRVMDHYPHLDADAQCSHCEKEALLVSLQNLESFPWLAKAKSANQLQCHAWHFDVESGTITRYDETEQQFVPLLEAA